MTDTEAWFAAENPLAGIREGSASAPENWPELAVETEFAADEEAYYRRLHDVAIETVREEVRARERADDQQLVHAVRAMDDAARAA